MNKYIIMLEAATSESKKFITFLLIIILAVVVLIGFIYSAIVKWGKKKAKAIDIYLYDMCEFQLLTTPKQVSNYCIKREIKNNYLRNRWFIRVAILTTGLFALFMFIFHKNNYQLVWDILNNMKFELTWPKGNFWGLKNFPIDWPKLTKASTFDTSLLGYCVYIELMVLIVLVVRMIKTSIIFFFKMRRLNDKAEEYFHQIVEKNSEK